MSANAATDSNSNFISVLQNTPVIVASLTLALKGAASHTVFVIGEFSADTVGATGGAVVASVLVDGNLMMDAQVNNQQGNAGPLVSVSGVLTLPVNKHKFELQAFVTGMGSASVHHRSLTVIDLG
jgi:intracellular septation protein A